MLASLLIVLAAATADATTIPTSNVRSAVSAALPGDSVLWEAAGEVLLQNWVADGWWLKQPVTLECAEIEATGEKCRVDGGGSRMVIWVENTSGVDGPIVLRGLKITGGQYSTSATTSVGGILILNSEVVMMDCEVSFNIGITSHPAGSAGGGIFISGSSFVELFDTSFFGNSAISPRDFHGRDIFANTGDLVVHGCSFADGRISNSSAPNMYFASAQGTFKSSCGAGEFGVPQTLELPMVFKSSPRLTTGTAASYAQNFSGSCRPCDPGSFSSRFAQRCTLCPVGKYNKLPGGNSSAACSNCTAGSYAAIPGTVTCDGCPAGTSSVTLAASTVFACDACAPGSFSQSGATSCTTCSPGTIAAIPGASECVLCGAGTHTPSDGAGVVCIPCLPSEEVVDNACTCNVDHYYDGSGQCTACPYGGECGGSNVTALSIAPRQGFWKTPWDALLFVECRNIDACTVNATGGGMDGACNDGYYGPLCYSCDAGRTRSLGLASSCVECYDQNIQVVVTLLCVCCGILLAVILIRRTLLTAANPSRLEVQILKIAASHLQLVAMARSFPLRWPTWVVQMFSTFDFASSTGESALALECLDPEVVGGKEGKSPFVVTATLLLVLPMVCAASAAAFWSELRCWRHRRRRVPSAELRLPAVAKLRTEEPSERLPERYVSGFVVTNLVLLFLLHPTLTRAGLRFFTCSPEDMGGPTFLEADFTMECWQSTHLRKALTLGAPLLLLYAIGIPLLALVLLRRAKRHGLDRWRPVLGFLFNGFKPRFYYWETVIASRKLTFAFVSVVLRSIGGDIQAYTGLGVIAVAMMLRVSYAPYEDPEINRMELLGLVVSFGTLFCGLYLFSPNTFEWLRILCSLAIVTINAGFLSCVLYKLLRGMVSEAGNMLRQIASPRSTRTRSRGSDCSALGNNSLARVMLFNQMNDKATIEITSSTASPLSVPIKRVELKDEESSVS